MIQTGFSEINEERLAYKGNDPWYMEVAITGKCNFSCKYCNRFNEEIDIAGLEYFLSTVPQLHHIQMTGGEPTQHKDIVSIVTMLRKHTKVLGMSTNGSAPLELYQNLPIDMFSISLDDYVQEILEWRGYKDVSRVITNIAELSKDHYVNVGLVLDVINYKRADDIISYLKNLGVSDIKISISSHEVDTMPKFNPLKDHSDYPILNYRVNNFLAGRPMRGFPTDKCHIMKNDITVVGMKHYPCLVYFREGGDYIGPLISGTGVLRARAEWYKNHNCLTDPICSKFCMDFKCDFNKALEESDI
jgi:organic radical activating enzyme